MSDDDKKKIMDAFKDGRRQGIAEDKGGPTPEYVSIIPAESSETEQAAYEDFVKKYGDPHAVKEVGEFVGNEDDMTYDDWAHTVWEDLPAMRIGIDPCETQPEWSNRASSKPGRGTAYDRRMYAVWELVCLWGKTAFKDADDLHTQMWGELRKPIPYAHDPTKYARGLHLNDEDKRDLPNVIEAQFEYYTQLLYRKRNWDQNYENALEALHMLQQ